MDLTDVLRNAIVSSEQNILEHISNVSSKETRLELLSLYEEKSSKKLIEATQLYSEKADPAHNLLTAILFQREAIHAIERHNFSSAFNTLLTVTHSIGCYSGAVGHKSAKARVNAFKSHSETRRLREEVVAYWEANISIDLSAEKAAAILIKEFPLSFRTISAYVSAAKKIRRASGL